MTSSTALANRTGTLLAPQLDYVLMDGSGSMHDKWWEMHDALDAYFASLRAAGTPSHVIAATFDTKDVNCLQRDCTLDAMPTFEQEPLGRYGGLTPLYDAINVMACRIRDLQPTRCSIIIVTDGHENASTHTDLTQARALLNWLRAKGYQITFIGCDFNNSEQARALGVNEHSAIGVQRALLTDAAKSLAEKRKRYGLYGTDMHFTDEEKTQFGGYLASPDKAAS